MAEYKALAQNTFKFVNETILHNNGNISSPCEGNIGRVKMIDDGKAVYYIPLAPVTTSTSATACSINQRGYTNKATTKPGMDTVPAYCIITMRHGSCVVDGIGYFGLKNADFGYSLWDTVSATYTKKHFPDGNAMVVMYKAATGKIEVESYPFKAATINATTEITGTTAAYGYTYQYWYIAIPKTANDIILAISIDYPKYDVAINNAKAGLQYSTDDGATFQDVADGLYLEQIEHVVFKNTGADAVNIGTTEAGTEIGTIAAGATFVAVPTADGAWFIS